METILKVTKWPNDDLKKKADALSAIFATMAESLNGDNPDKAKAGAAAHEAHEGAHEFSDAVWQYLENKASVKTPAAAADGPHWDWKDPTGREWRLLPPDGRVVPKGTAR